MKIGFDIGGVIVDQKTREVFPECYMSIKLCIEKFRPDNIFIVSKARNKWVDENKKMLKESNFYSLTGFLETNVYFVDEYKDKATMCEKLQLDYLVDDSVKVIKFLLETNTIGIWFGPNNTSCLNKDDLKKIHVANTWKNLRKLFSKLSIPN